MSAPPETDPLSIEEIARRNLNARSKRGLLDADLAAFYGVVTKAFDQQVRRTLGRFPPDFMYQLNDGESTALRSQFVTLKNGRGQHRNYLPLAFTEHGAIVAAAILNSPRATVVSVHVVRAFIELRDLVGNCLKRADAPGRPRVSHTRTSESMSIAG